MKKKPLEIAILGCGNRGRIYMDLISEQTENFLIVAGADPTSGKCITCFARCNRRI